MDWEAGWSELANNKAWVSEARLSGGVRMTVQDFWDQCGGNTGSFHNYARTRFFRDVVFSSGHGSNLTWGVYGAPTSDRIMTSTVVGRSQRQSFSAKPCLPSLQRGCTVRCNTPIIHKERMQVNRAAHGLRMLLEAEVVAIHHTLEIL